MTAPAPDLIRAAWTRHEADLRRRFLAGHGPVLWVRVRKDGETLPIPFTLKRQDFGNEYTVDGDGLVVAQGEWPL